MREAVILDTNVVVAAGFRPDSSAGRVVQHVRAGQLRMIWNDATRRETRYVLEKIPRRSWEEFEDLFSDRGCYRGRTRTHQFELIGDPGDRKFAALAEATGAVVVTNDRDLLIHRDRLRLAIRTPREICRHLSPSQD